MYKSYEGRGYCEEHLVKYVERKVKRTLGKYKLIEYGDKVAIAISGGKDSMLMIHLIHKIFKNVRRVEYFALSVDEGIKGYRKNALKKAKTFAKKLGIEYIEVKFKDSLGITIDEIVKKISKENDFSKEKICTWCGVLKRHLINIKARELGATKVAVGHTLDDEAESVIMNFIRGDLNRFVKLGPMPIILRDKKFIPRIKPLREITTEEVIAYNKIKKIPYYSKRCPNATDNVRLHVQRALNELEKMYPGTKYQIVRFYDTVQPLILKSLKIGRNFNYCKKCGEPSSRDVCRVCELLKKIKN